MPYPAYNLPGLLHEKTLSFDLVLVKSTVEVLPVREGQSALSLLLVLSELTCMG